MASTGENAPLRTPGTDPDQKKKEAYFTASQSQLIWARFKKNRAAMTAATVLVVMALMGIFAPIVSGFHAKEDTGQMRRHLKLVSRWMFSCSWPSFLFFFLYSRQILSVLGEVFVPFEITPGHLGIDEYDLVDQRLTSHHYWIDGDRVETFDSPHRYAWPAEYDLMARIAGITLVERWADWHRTPFTNDSTTHVSVWQKPSDPPPA